MNLEESKRKAAEIKRRIDLKLFYCQELEGNLRKGGGWSDGLKCPFCNDNKTDNFRIDLSSGGFKCLKCQISGGDCIDFTMRRYGMGFKEAAKKLSGEGFTSVGVVNTPPPVADPAANYAEAAESAARVWDKAAPATNHPYLIKKRVQPHNTRILDNALIIPLFNSDGMLSTIQRIRPDGTKRLHTGGKKSGSFFLIGEEVTSRILIAEGFATCASLYEATGKLAVMAIDASNLKAVAEIVRGKNPDAELIVCGDNDLSGVGQKAANAAALAVGGKVIIPPEAGQDWNDFICAGGVIYG